MATNYGSKILSQLNPFDSGDISRKPRRKKGWEPIKYTSMRWYMMLNYACLLALIALPISIIYAIWSVLS